MDHMNHKMDDTTKSPVDPSDQSMDDMMMMYFHTGFKDTILFQFWKSTNVSLFVVSCLVVFLVTVSYEGIRFLRQRLVQIEMRQASFDVQTMTQSNSFISKLKSTYLSKIHLLQTIIHMVQVAISYLLMLVVMTFNVWLYLSVVLGAGVGYFIFKQKPIINDADEHCY